MGPSQLDKALHLARHSQLTKQHTVTKVYAICSKGWARMACTRTTATRDVMPQQERPRLLFWTVVLVLGVRPYVIHASQDVSYANNNVSSRVRSLQARQLQQRTTPPVLIASQCCQDRSGCRDFQMSFSWIYLIFQKELRLLQSS